MQEILDNTEIVPYILSYKKSKSKADLEVIYRNVEHLIGSIITKNFKGYGDKEDLAQEAIFPLLRCIENYNPEMGYFSNYIYFNTLMWLYRYMRKAKSPIKISVGMMNNICSIKKASVEFESKFNRLPTDEELFDNTGLSRKHFNLALRTKNLSWISLDQIIFEGDTSDSNFESIIGVEDDYSFLENKNYFDILKQAMVVLTDKQRTVITHRYGLDGNGAKTLREVGTMLKRSDERIRQIQSAAETKLAFLLKKKFGLDRRTIVW